VTAVVGGVTVIALAMLGAAALRPHTLIAWLGGRGIDPRLAVFLSATARWLILLSACGVLWSGLAALFVSACTAA
jgi:hypothetical protein